jgi:hypothetical protein
MEALPAAALREVNGEIAWLGQLAHDLMERRTCLRVRARHELGCIPERAEAVAVDRLLNGSLLQRIAAEADRIQARAAADLDLAPDALRSCPGPVEPVVSAASAASVDRP